MLLDVCISFIASSSSRRLRYYTWVFIFFSFVLFGIFFFFFCHNFLLSLLSMV